MVTAALEACPGCGALLPPSPAPSHRYIGASGACWDIYTSLHLGGQPPMRPRPHLELMVDAYAAQHPGVPGPQSIQSVAVHLLALHGVLEKGLPPGQALWVRQRALRGARQDRFVWLEPPVFAGHLTVAAIAQAPDPAARTALAERWVAAVYSAWAAPHAATIANWYEAYVLPDRLG
jgi:hypothetical protein